MLHIFWKCMCPASKTCFMGIYFQHLRLIGHPKSVTCLTLPVHFGPSTDPARNTAMWPLVRLHLPSRPATPHHWLLAALPTRASRLRAPPAAARCVPPDCASESDASNLLSLLATQQRATALAPTSAASQLIRNASLSTAHPFLAQQKPLHHTLSCTPSSGPAFNIFSRLALPLSSQQSLSSFTPADPPEACRRRRKKIHFQRGGSPPSETVIEL